jgi:pimeloyl-ACP methyl ester carboxylesterase/predicted enzyme related to lactoylglutathione lyase
VVHYVEHGTGRPVLILHGAGVDHREAEACFEPLLDGAPLRRIYPDLPGMGRTPAPETLRSADDVLDTLLAFAGEVTGGTEHLLIGHSAGAYYAQAMAARRPARVAGLALVCPLLPDPRDIPPHRVVAGSGVIGDDDFRSYFVIQTPEMLDRYERYVAPGAALADQAALERIGERWTLTPDDGPAYPGPVLVVAGRLDSTVGYAAATDLVGHYPHASLAVLDHAGHALPHEQPDLLRALLAEWLARVARIRPAPAGTGAIAPGGIGWVASVTIDAVDPVRLARFWAALLGLVVRPREGTFVALQRPPLGAPELVFQPVPEAKRDKVRIHLDVNVPDLPAAARRVQELGGSPVTEVHEAGDVWRVMRDPEDNEFCLIPAESAPAADNRAPRPDHRSPR